MRRGGQVSIAGAGGGGYNKPPPGPLSHASGGRMRLHTHDANGAAMKDRFGSPRERSPNLCSSLPLSPSHLNAREKSPNPTSQDLHDCSMCVSAYIQSLNTVCGTACRLAQCLAQVGADNGCNEASGTGTPLHQLLREAAEMWEGIARAVGVASTSVKNQVLILLQEAQARHTLEHSESARKVEVAKIMRTMLSTFLNLHCQFSLVVVERFSGMLHLLKEENGVYSAANFEGHRPSPSPSVSPHRPSPSPPQPSTQYSHLSAQQLLHQQLLQQQQQQQQHLALQQQILLQQMLQMSCNKNAPPTESPCSSSSRPEENGSRHSSGGSASALQAPVPPSVWLANLGSPVSSFSSQSSGNTLSPGMCAVGVGSESSGEALLRRWSMGCATSEEAWQDKPSMLAPFSLIANRRWSVPETTEHDSCLGAVAGTYPFYGSDHGAGVPSGRGSQNRGFGKNQFISRESSCTRSPSHSRSVTPDHSRRVSVVSSEELQDVIELLSLPLNGTKEEKPKPNGGKSFPSASQKGGDEGNPPHHHHHHPHSIPENESQELSSSPSFSTSSPRSSHDSQSSVPSEKGKSQSEVSPKMFQQSQWTSENSHDEREASSSTLYKNIPGEKVLKDNTNQISTSLWPPSDNVPGVTLTECGGETEKRVIPPWSDENGCCDESSNPSAGCFSRDSINRASWPISAFSGLGIVDDMLSGSHGGSPGGWASRPNVATFRRHSTDAPFLLPHGEHSPLTAKTRSFENIASKVNGNNNLSGSGIDTSIPDLFLPSLHSPFSSASSPATSHYTLFTTSN